MTNNNCFAGLPEAILKEVLTQTQKARDELIAALVRQPRILFFGVVLNSGAELDTFKGQIYNDVHALKLQNNGLAV